MFTVPRQRMYTDGYKGKMEKVSPENTDPELWSSGLRHILKAVKTIRNTPSTVHKNEDSRSNVTSTDFIVHTGSCYGVYVACEGKTILKRKENPHHNEAARTRATCIKWHQWS